jgi:hypothetical protein
MIGSRWGLLTEMYAAQCPDHDGEQAHDENLLRWVIPDAQGNTKLERATRKHPRFPAMTPGRHTRLELQYRPGAATTVILRTALSLFLWNLAVEVWRGKGIVDLSARFLWSKERPPQQSPTGFGWRPRDWRGLLRLANGPPNTTGKPTTVQ